MKSGQFSQVPIRLIVLLALIGSVLALPLIAQAAVARSKLTAVSGEGSGMVIIAPTARGHGHFTAEMTVNVHGTSPNTTFELSRAPDFNGDGSCTGTVYRPFGESLTTSPGGAGATHWHYEAPFPSGTQFDVIVRAEGDDGTVLQSECITITVK